MSVVGVNPPGGPKMASNSLLRRISFSLSIGRKGKINVGMVVGSDKFGVHTPNKMECDRMEIQRHNISDYSVCNIETTRIQNNRTRCNGEFLDMRDKSVTSHGYAHDMRRVQTRHHT